MDREAMITKKTASKGLRSKIDAYCISCIYDEKARGTWRQQVEACTVSTCPLYSIRAKASKE